MNMPVSITLFVKFLTTAVIFPPFHKLVEHFNPHRQLQKADRMVGIVPL